VILRSGEKIIFHLNVSNLTEFSLDSRLPGKPEVIEIGICGSVPVSRPGIMDHAFFGLTALSSDDTVGGDVAANPEHSNQR
jgi:hypothetical protein